MGPLLGIAVNLIPDLIRVFAGDKGGVAAEKVTEAIKQVAASDDEETVRKKLESDPAAKAELQKRLADIALEQTRLQLQAEADMRRIDLDFYKEKLAEVDRARQDEFDRLKVEIEDRNLARNNALLLSREGGPISWVIPALSIIVALGLFYFLYRLMTVREPIENRDVLNTLLGALTTAFITIISFYFGSSSGSRDKDNLIASGQLVSSAQPPQSQFAPNSNIVIDPGGIKQTERRRDITYTGRFALFQQKAPGVMRQLMSDFNLSPEQAAGVLGNIGHECNGFRTMQEVNPRSGRGGLGWCQWTGPRRRQFEEWTRSQGLDFTSDGANYGFLRHELTTSEARVLGPLRQSTTIERATEVFMRVFERPGIAHLDRRIDWAQLALKTYREVQVV